MCNISKPIADEAVAALLDLARSANVYFELVNDRMTIRAVQPCWTMWRPVGHLLDEIGQKQVEAFLRRRSGARPGGSAHEPSATTLAPWPDLKDSAMHWARATRGR